MTTVILKETIKDLGQKGDVKNVADGYARNFLLPNGLVILATESAMKKAEEWQKEEAKRQEQEKTSYKELAQLLRETTIQLEEKVKDDNKQLYGSVTASDIAEILKEKRIDVQKSWVQLKSPLKTVGTHSVTIILPHNIPAEVSITIEKEA